MRYILADISRDFVERPPPRFPGAIRRRALGPGDGRIGKQPLDGASIRWDCGSSCPIEVAGKKGPACGASCGWADRRRQCGMGVRSRDPERVRRGRLSTTDVRGWCEREVGVWILIRITEMQVKLLLHPSIKLRTHSSLFPGMGGNCCRMAVNWVVIFNSLTNYCSMGFVAATSSIHADRQEMRPNRPGLSVAPGRWRPGTPVGPGRGSILRGPCHAP
jgi:hypothetical protein